MATFGELAGTLTGVASASARRRQAAGLGQRDGDAHRPDRHLRRPSFATRTCRPRTRRRPTDVPLRRPLPCTRLLAAAAIRSTAALTTSDDKPCW